MQNTKDSNSSLNANSLNDDLQFLINCCKTNPSKEDIKFIRSSIQHIDTGSESGMTTTRHFQLDWGSTLIGLANQHGILPLVYKTLKNLQPVMVTSSRHPELLELNSDTPVSKEQKGCVSGSTESQSDSSCSSRNTSHVTRNTLEHLLTDLKSAYSQIAHRNMLMSAELLRIMKLLEENNIDALAFKGPTLAQMAYDDITLRQYSDLDILVDEKDAYKAGKLMSENGHTAILPFTILSNKTSLQTVKDFSLISEPGGVHTELHWRLFKKKYNIAFHSCLVDKKCQTVKINGKEIKTLQNELLLVYLCMHGATHTFERIEWICDIDRLIRSCDVDWEEAMIIANQSQSKHSFYLGLSLAHHLLHAPLPSKIIKNINRGEIHTLHTMVLKQMSEKQNNFRHHYYHTMLFDTLALKANYLRHHIFTPTKEDYKTVSLPTLLFPLYLVIRPFRFLSKIIKKLLLNK